MQFTHPRVGDARREAETQRADVVVRRARHGMSRLVAYLPTERADAVHDTISQTAHTALTAGDTRPLGVLRMGALVDRVLRPWNDHTPVTAHLTIDIPLSALRPPPAGTVGEFLDTSPPAPAA